MTVPRSHEEVERAIVETQAWLDSVDPETLPESAIDDRKDLRRIGAALLAIEGSQEALVRAVSDARSRGRSWTDIAGVLGVSRQAARQRFTSLTKSDESEDEPSDTSGLATQQAVQWLTQQHPRTWRTWVFKMPHEQTALLLPRLSSSPAEQMPPENVHDPDDVEELILSLAPEYNIPMRLILHMLDKEPPAERRHVAEVLAMMSLLGAHDPDNEGSVDRPTAKHSEPRKREGRRQLHHTG
jgi:hypothetical protein